MRLREMRNLGPASEEMLVAVGIRTPAELDELGSVEAYRKVLAIGPRRPTLNLLWALEGALLDIDWRDLPPDRRAALLTHLDSTT